MIEVLIVEDEFMVAAIHTGFVERTPGFAVTGVAHTGAQRSSRRSGFNRTSCCSTSTFPDVSGLDLLGALREAAPRSTCS